MYRFGNNKPYIIDKQNRVHKRTATAIFQKTLASVMLALLIFAAVPLSALAGGQKGVSPADDMSIKLDGELIQLKDGALKKDKRLYLPVAILAALFGAKTVWDPYNETATIQTTMGDVIVLGNQVPVVYFNKARYVMDAAPFLANGRMYIPLRHVAELLHARVTWNEQERTAELQTVQPAVVTEEYAVAEIAKDTNGSVANLLLRNELKSEVEIAAGDQLRIVIPSIFSKEAKPFTEEDYMLLAKITQVEAGGESYEGQLAVANVILNRVKDSRFPGTISDVIYAGKQFPPAHNGKLDKSVPNKSVLRAAKDALNGRNNVADAVYFFNPKVSKGSFWDARQVIATIGNHSFAK